MAQNPLAPPPPSGNSGFDRWMYLLWRRLTQAGQILWGSLDFSGSNLTDLATRNHVDLQNHNTADYYHLTQAHHTDLTDGGDSSLHYHTADRLVEISKEAGEVLGAGDPVTVSANKFYKATHTTNPHVAGIVRDSVGSGLVATAVVSGPLTLSGLSDGSPYFLGAGAIASSAPASGYVVKLGTAVSTTILLVSIENPVLLS